MVLDNYTAYNAVFTVIQSSTLLTNNLANRFSGAKGG